MRILSAAALLLAPLLSLPAAGQDAETTLFAGSTRGVLYALSGADGRKVWHRKLRGGVSGGPVVRGDRIYVATAAGVQALATKGGEEVWFAPSPSPIPHAAAVAGGRVFAGAEDGALTALDAASGDRLWTKRLGSAAAGPPVPAGQAVFVLTADGTVRALAGASGELLWRAENAGAIPTGPAVGDGAVHVALWPGRRRSSAATGRLVAYDARTGAVRWRVSDAGLTSAPPVAAGGSVFLLTQDTQLRAFDAKSGRLRWRCRLGPAGLSFTTEIECAPLVAGGAVYVLGYGLRAFDAATGRALWRTPLEGRARGLAMAEGLLALATFSRGCAPKPGGPGSIRAFDPATGRERWSVPTKRDGFTGVPTLAR